MLRYAADYGVAATEGTEHAPKWDSLIETSHSLLSDSQCDDTGLVVSDRGSSTIGGCKGVVQQSQRPVGGCWSGVTDVRPCRASAELVRAQRRHDRLLGLRHPCGRVRVRGLAHPVARRA